MGMFGGAITAQAPTGPGPQYRPQYFPGMGGSMSNMAGALGPMRNNTAEETARLRSSVDALPNQGQFGHQMANTQDSRGKIGLGISYGLNPARTQVTGGQFYDKMANNQSLGVRPGALPQMNAVQAARAGMGGSMPSQGAALAGYMNQPRR